jgi:hypothetical protein
VSVDLAFAGGFDGQIDHVLVIWTTADCAPSDCVEGMQPKGFSDSTMWPSLVVGVVDVLADFEVAFAAAAREL